MNHVVEHLPDALSTLSECRRILRPGGTLVLYTPNSASLGHAIFGSHWRGLEPPRHLNVFGPRSLAELLRQAGFEECHITTANSEYYWRESLRLWAMSARSAAPLRLAGKAASLAMALAAQAVRPFSDQRGESLVAHATRVR